MPPRRRSQSPQRRKLIWGRRDDTITLTGVTSSALNLLAEFETRYGANLVGATIMGIRGALSVVQTAGTAPGQVVVAASVMPDAVTTVLPSTHPESDWMMWEPFLTNINNVHSNLNSRLIQVRSRRKFDELQVSPVVVFESTGGGTSPVWSVLSNLSVLLALP